MRHRQTLWAVASLLAVWASLAVAIRVMPVDPGKWHVDMAAPGFAPESHWSAFCPRPGDRFAPDIRDPAALLAALDTIAKATPRTQRLAGSPAARRITWITRSLVMGFPDFTTAQVLRDRPGDAARLCILGRQGIGRYDRGVNAARITGWAQTLLGLNEPPDLRAF